MARKKIMNIQTQVNRLGSHYAIHSGSGTGGRSNLWRSIGRGSGGTSHNNATVSTKNFYTLL